MRLSDGQLDAFEAKIEPEVAVYLGKDGRLAANKLAAFLHTTFQDAYVIKAYVERSFDRFCRDPEMGGSPEKPISYAELGAWLESNYREVERLRAEKGKEPERMDECVSS